MKRGAALFILLLAAIAAIVVVFGRLPLLGPQGFDSGDFELVEDIEFQDVCLGRHVVSLPSGWPRMEQTLAVGGLNISRLGPADGKAETLFRAREAELASGAVKDGYAEVVLRWAQHGGGAFALSHSLKQEPGWPEPMQTVEGWIDRDGVTFQVTGNPLAEDAAFGPVSEMLKRLRPRDDDTPPSEAGTCFDGGYMAGQLTGDELAAVEMNSDTEAESFVNLSLSLWLQKDRPGEFNPERFGELTREYDIAGVPGGERVAIIENELARDSGLEFLATAGGSVNGVGLQIRGALTKQSAFPATPPLVTEDALTIWHTMLRFIRPTG